MRILTKELVEKAIELVRPVAEKILNTEGTTWGPKWVRGVVKLPGLLGPLDVIGFEFGDVSIDDFGDVSTEWNPDWGERKNFREIAETKLETAIREDMNTSFVVATRPWQLLPGEYLYAGGATRNGISVAVSGAKGVTDEALAEMVISAIIMLALLETEKRLKEGKEQI